VLFVSGSFQIRKRLDFTLRFGVILLHQATIKGRLGGEGRRIIPTGISPDWRMIVLAIRNADAASEKQGSESKTPARAEASVSDSGGRQKE